MFAMYFVEVGENDLILSVLISFQCDRCECEPIVGTRWHCTDCPDETAVDFCDDCVDL